MESQHVTGNLKTISCSPQISAVPQGPTLEERRIVALSLCWDVWDERWDMGYYERVSHNNESILYKLVPICQFGRGISSQIWKRSNRKPKSGRTKGIPNNEWIKLCVISTILILVRIDILHIKLYGNENKNFSVWSSVVLVYESWLCMMMFFLQSRQAYDT